MTDQPPAWAQAILARIERLESCLGLAPVGEVGGDAGTGEDDFADAAMVDLGAAAARFAVEKDTLRRWCRDEGIGIRRGGRWTVSVPRLRRHLGR